MENLEQAVVNEVKKVETEVEAPPFFASLEAKVHALELSAEQKFQALSLTAIGNEFAALVKQTEAGVHADLALVNIEAAVKSAVAHITGKPV